MTLISGESPALGVSDRKRLAVVLAAVGGYVDAVGYIALFRLFTAHQSGNSAGLGVAIGEGHWVEALHRMTSIGAFVLAVAVGALLIEVADRAGVRSTATVVLGLEAALLIAAVAVGRSEALGGRVAASHVAAYYSVAGLLAAAMGVQTAVLRKAGSITVRTTFVTGVLTNLAEGLVIALFNPRRRKGALALSGVEARLWGAYLAGAVAGALAQVAWSLFALLVPVSAIAVCIVVDQRRPLQPTLPRPPEPSASSRPGGSGRED